MTSREEVYVVAVDVETTGLECGLDRIIQLGICWGGLYAPPYTWHLARWSVWPGGNLAAYRTEACAVHGMDYSEVARYGVPFDEAWAAAMEWVKTADLIIGYKVNFDLEFIRQECRRCGAGPGPGYPDFLVDRPRLDVLDVVRDLLPGLQRKGLQDVLRWMGIASDKPHDALTDAEGSLRVLQRLRDMFPRDYPDYIRELVGENGPE